MKPCEYLLRVRSDGTPEQIPAAAGRVTQKLLAELLGTDVTERFRVSQKPPELQAGDSVLCFFLDARSGDRSLNANTLATCLYHTGCPIYGDMIFALCAQDSDSAAVSGFDEMQYAQLFAWLKRDFSALLHENNTN